MTHEECERALAQAQGEIERLKAELFAAQVAVCTQHDRAVAAEDKLAATSQATERLKESEKTERDIADSLEREADDLRKQLAATSQDILRAQVDQMAMQAMYTVLTFVWGQYPEMRHVLDALEEKYPTKEGPHRAGRPGMMTADDIVNGPKALRGDRWVPSRPLSGPWIWRLRDAWAVLTGRAEAVTFSEPGGQP